MVCTISRILFKIDIYLGWLLPTTSSGTLDCSSTALHTSKDLAVSLHMLPYELIHEGCLHISVRASLLAPLGLPVRVLPATRTNLHRCVFGLSSLRLATKRIYLVHQKTLPHLTFPDNLLYSFCELIFHKIINHNMPKRKDPFTGVFSFVKLFCIVVESWSSIGGCAHKGMLVELAPAVPRS